MHEAIVIFFPLLTMMWVIHMSQVVLYEPFMCIAKDLRSEDKIVKG